MPKTSEVKDPDAFEQEMGYRITNLEKAIRLGTGNGSYTKGEKSGFEYALAIYRDCREAALI